MRLRSVLGLVLFLACAGGTATAAEWTCSGICGYQGGQLGDKFAIPTLPVPKVPIGEGRTPKEAFEAALKQCPPTGRDLEAAGPYLVKMISAGQGYTAVAPVLIPEACVSH